MIFNRYILSQTLLTIVTIYVYLYRYQFSWKEIKSDNKCVYPIAFSHCSTVWGMIGGSKFPIFFYIICNLSGFLPEILLLIAWFSVFLMRFFLFLEILFSNELKKNIYLCFNFKYIVLADTNLIYYQFQHKKPPIILHKFTKCLHILVILFYQDLCYK